MTVEPLLLYQLGDKRVHFVECIFGVHIEEVVNTLKGFEGDINVLLLASFEDVFRLFDGHFIVDAAQDLVTLTPFVG